MSHSRAILAIARKDTLEILRDKTTIGGLVGPIALAFLFLLISRLVGGRTTTLLVYNPSQSPVQQVVTGAFPQTTVTMASSPDEVTAAFGPNGAQVASAYDVGLIVPPDFQQATAAGSRPQISLYINESSVTPQQSTLLQAAILDYARTVAQPQPPVNLATAIVNPVPTINTGQVLAGVYTPIVLLLALAVGISLMPYRLIEEKERRTLRAILVAPASYGDVIVGKLVPIVVYQIVEAWIVVIIVQRGLPANVPLMFLYIVLGSLLALSVGLLIGSLVQTTSAAGTISGLAIFAFIIPGIFAGYLGQVIGGNSLVVQIFKFLPPYYVSDGGFDALQGTGTLASNLLDVGVILGSTAILLAVSTWFLRRQATVVATI